MAKPWEVQSQSTRGSRSGRRRRPSRRLLYAAPPSRHLRVVLVHPTAEGFQARLRELGLDAEVRELADSTRTAQEAADAVGVDVGQIVKSLVFVDQGSPLLCLCAGDRRVD